MRLVNGLEWLPDMIVKENLLDMLRTHWGTLEGYLGMHGTHGHYGTYGHLGSMLITFGVLVNKATGSLILGKSVISLRGTLYMGRC